MADTVQLREDSQGVPLQVNGADVGMGSGALVRMREGSKTGSQALVSAPAELLFDGVAGLRVTLPNPKAQYEYRVECEFDVINTDTLAGGSVTGALQVSYDGGATFPQTLAMDAMNLGPASQEHMHVRFTLADLPALPNPAPASVIARCMAAAPSGGSMFINGGVGRMSIEEHIPQ